MEADPDPGGPPTQVSAGSMTSPHLDDEQFVEDEGLLLHHSILEVFSVEILFEMMTYLDWQELIVMSQTCRAFRDICTNPTVWAKLQRLDFRYCKVPTSQNILNIAKQCPNARILIMDGVICEEDSMEVEDEANNETDTDEQEEHPGPNDDADVLPPPPKVAVGYDKLILEILRHCPRLRQIKLACHELTNVAVEAIAAKSCMLEELSVSDSQYITNRAVSELVSALPTLRCLSLIRNTRLVCLDLVPDEDNNLLPLTTVRLCDIVLLQGNVVSLAKSCPQLEHLTLQRVDELSAFTPEDGIQVSDFPKLQTLTLSCCFDLMSVQIGGGDSQLKLLDVTDCPALRSIDLRCPLVETVLTGGCNLLESVTLHSTQLTEATFSNHNHLANLNMQCPKLQKIDFTNCLKLTVDSLLTIKNLDQIKKMTLMQCIQMSPDILREKLLPKMSQLTDLVYGGHAWTQTALDSASLQSLVYQNVRNTPCLVLNMPKLRNLVIKGVQDINEEELMDGLLLGKHIQRRLWLVPQAVNPAEVERPTADQGVNNLTCLQLVNLRNLQGSALSRRGILLHNLAILEITACYFLQNLVVQKWKNLQSLKLSSCSKLKEFIVTNMPKLTTLHVKWCGMVDKLHVSAVPSLVSMDTNGTNFASYCVTCPALKCLDVAGVCTTPQHTARIRCERLEQLSLCKCDAMTDEVLHDMLAHSPGLHTLHLVACQRISYLSVPACIEVLRLTGLRRLSTIHLSPQCQLQQIAFNNLPKIKPDQRLSLLLEKQHTVRTLEVRALANETSLTLPLAALSHLTLDQGIHLRQLEISCPSLQYLRIQGCPHLKELKLHVSELPRLQIDHSAPLLTLRKLELHTSNMKFLGRVLGYYCPHLEELMLVRAQVSSGRVLGVGHALPHLISLDLRDCHIIGNLCGDIDQCHLSAAMLQRTTDLPLKLHISTASLLIVPKG